MIPQSPQNYSVHVDTPSTGVFSWTNGAGAESVRHEVSTDGVNWSRLDDVFVPASQSAHSLPYPSLGQPPMNVYLRGKSVSADGESEYTPLVTVQTESYEDR